MLRQSFYRYPLAVVGASLLFGLSAQAQVTDITIVDPSFELVDIAAVKAGQGFPIGEDPGPADTTLPQLFFWNETGAESTEQGFTGLIDTGHFINIDTTFTLGESSLVLPKVPNVPEGEQIAYMRYNRKAGGQIDSETGLPFIDPNTGLPYPATTISQQTQEMFQADSLYTFSMKIGSSGVLSTPGDSTGINPYTAILQIGYYDDGSTAEGGFTSLASEVIDITDLLSTGFLTAGGDLKEFSVNYTTGDTIAPSLSSEKLVVLIEQAGGTTGSINVDDASLTRAVVPEPSSLALLGLSGLLVMRRRR